MRKINKLTVLILSTAMTVLLTACGTRITAISLDSMPETMENGNTYHISAEYGYNGSTPETAKAEKLIEELGLTYKSSNSEIISVDADGNLKAVAPGRADIVVVSADGKISAEKTITVTVAPTGINMTDSVQVTLEDPVVKIKAEPVPKGAADAHISFKSLDDSIVTVDEGGSLRAVSDGETMIKATIDGTQISNTCKVTVLPSAEVITLSDSYVKLTVDEEKELTFTVVPENACTDYRFWYSSDESVATVDENGKITAHKDGTCEILLAISDVNASCKVTVTNIGNKAVNKGTSTGVQAEETSQVVAQGNSADATDSAASASGGKNDVSSVSEISAAGHGQWTVFGDGQARALINSLRASLGLGELAWNDALGDVAAARCQQLMDDFSHNGMTAPEICAMGTVDAASTVAAWQGSSAHYAQMTYPDYTQVAIAHCYDGDGCHYWCATFG